MQSRQGLASILAYCKQDKKTLYDGRKLVSGVNCVAESAFNEMMNTKIQYRKTDGRMYYHLFQSFHPDEPITPETAHEIALKFAQEQFKGYEVLVATHIDREHIHSHFILNSVSAETGLKYHPDKNEIQRLRDYSDNLCRKYGLSVVIPKQPKVKQMSAREYRSADKGQSWKLQLAIAVDEAMKYATSKEHFISLMENEGYEVKWTAERKSITYTTPNGMKCRDNKLHEEKYLKENMEYEFGIREIILGGTESEGAAEYAESLRSEALRNGNRAELERIARYAEGADRTALTAYERNRNADDQRGTDGVYERAAEYPDREQRTVPSGGDGISEQDEEIGDGIYRLDENGRVGYRETGWEDQRLLFEQSLHADGYGGEVFEPDILDHGYSLGYNGTVLSDAAYLAADITGIIDDDAPVEDCTTMHFPSEHKKKHSGPVMGGM